MSHLLHCTGLEKSYTRTPLFKDLSVSIEEGDRIGLIGPNGAGKSTFLRILAGLDDADGGQVIARKGLTISYLPQSEEFGPDERIDEILFAATPQYRSEDERHVEVAIMRQRVGLISSSGEQPAQVVRELSGGFRKRLAIASRLLKEPDVLLLDEPTNHLDLESIEWLEELLLESRFAFVVISHDRTFLERVTTRTVEISRRYPKGCLAIDVSYERFVERREEVVAQLVHAEASLANAVRRETEWLRRQPRARTTKSSARIQEAESMINQLSQARARSRSNSQAEVDFSSTTRQSKRLLAAENLTKRFEGRTVVHDLDLVLTRGMKLGIVGRNGSGKSTILRMIRGELKPDAGTIWLAPDVRIVSFDQSRAGLDPEKTVRRYLAPESDSVLFQGKDLHVVSYAARYLFRADQIDTKIAALSGGEQARLLIAKLILEPADILLLDEPTNDLDIDTLEALEESLKNFTGAVVLVTHDRSMIQEVCDLFLVLHDGAWKFVASYDQWQAYVADQQSVKRDRAVGQDGNVASSERRSGLSKEEKRELGQIERTIAKAEQRVQEIEARLAVVAQQGKNLVELSREYQQAKANVESLFQRWGDLEARRDDSH